MATSSSVPIGTILRTVRDDLGEVWVRLRNQSIIGFAITVIFALIDAIPAISDNRVLAEAVELMGKVAILPLQIAIFRQLILGETTSGYHFELTSKRFQRMLGWTVAFSFLATIPTHLPAAIAPSIVAEVIISIPLVATAITIALRLAILLPAIAADAPGASVRNAFADTRGHVWFILKAYFITLLPFILIGIVVALEWPSTAGDMQSGKGKVIASMLFSPLAFVAWTSFAIVSARLFMRIGDRVKGDAPEASE